MDADPKIVTKIKKFLAKNSPKPYCNVCLGDASNAPASQVRYAMTALMADPKITLQHTSDGTPQCVGERCTRNRNAGFDQKLGTTWVPKVG